MEINDTKLVLLLRTFNKTEFEKFEKFVKSPFFNSSEQLVSFFEILKKDHPDYKVLTKEKIFGHFYPKEEYKDKKIRDLFSRMLEIAQSFLAQLELEKNENTKSFYVLRQLLERRLERHFKSRYKETEKNLSAYTIIDEEYFISEYTKLKLNLEQLNTFKNVSLETSYGELIYDEYDHFLNFVIYKVLNYTLVFSIRKYSLNSEVNLEFSGKVIEFLDKYPRENYPVISIIRNVLRLQSKENEPVSDEDVQTYNMLVGQLTDNFDNLNKENKRFIYIYLVNYTRLKSLAYNPYFKEEYYRLLKFSIENDLYPKENNYFNESSYVIVATEALIRKDFEWAEYFIEKYKLELKDEVRENAYTLCMANLYYRKGNYEKALKFLVKVSIEDIYYQLKVKNLQVKIHYEIGDYEMCKSVIDSFRHFLSSVKQFPEFVRIRFVNYINLTSRMVNVWLGGDPRNMIEINREIKEIAQEKVESKSWLIAQAAKIKY